jgi:hypothetical protein
MGGNLRELIWKRLHGVVAIGAGNPGNAASRVVVHLFEGRLCLPARPDLTSCFEAAGERNLKSARRVSAIQQTIDRAMPPVMDLRALMGIGSARLGFAVTDVR